MPPASKKFSILNLNVGPETRGGNLTVAGNLTVTAAGLANGCKAGVDRLRGIQFDGASGSIIHNAVVGINKVAGEYYHLVYDHVFGVRACSLRLTNVYGPRQLIKHNRQGFIGWFIRLAVEGRDIEIYGDGSQMRDFVYVDDVVEAFLAELRGSRTFRERVLPPRRPGSLLQRFARRPRAAHSASALEAIGNGALDT